MMPFLRFSTRCSSTSRATTRFPRSAKQAAVTRPTYPTPITQICFILLYLFVKLFPAGAGTIFCQQTDSHSTSIFCFRKVTVSSSNDFTRFSDLLLFLFSAECPLDHIQKPCHMDGLRNVPVTARLEGPLAVAR